MREEKSTEVHFDSSGLKKEATIGFDAGRAETDAQQDEEGSRTLKRQEEMRQFQYMEHHDGFTSFDNGTTREVKDDKEKIERDVACDDTWI